MEPERQIVTKVTHIIRDIGRLMVQLDGSCRPCPGKTSCPCCGARAALAGAADVLTDWAASHLTTAAAVELAMARHNGLARSLAGKTSASSPAPGKPGKSLN